MKKYKITLVSHYSRRRLNLRIPEEAYLKLFKSDSPIELIYDDQDKVDYGFEPKYLSRYQCRKVNNFFPKDGCDYFDCVEFCDL